MSGLLSSGKLHLSSYVGADFRATQDLDARISYQSLIAHQFAVLGMAYAAEVFERGSSLYGILWPPKDFFIVRK